MSFVFQAYICVSKTVKFYLLSENLVMNHSLIHPVCSLVFVLLYMSVNFVISV